MMAKYRKIYQELVDGIRNGIYPAGKLLPGEYELMEHYGASRDTIRKALSILSADGYIQRKQGLGSIVLESERISFTLSGLHSFKEETQSLGKEVSTQVITFGKGQPDDRVRTILECDEGEEVWMIERVRTIDHEAIILDMDYLPISLVPALSRDMVEDSLYTCLEETLSMDIAYAKKAITIQEACDKDYKYLDMKHYSMVAQVESVTCLNNATVLLYTISHHRPDKFVYHDFARRDQKV